MSGPLTLEGSRGSRKVLVAMITASAAGSEKHLVGIYQGMAWPSDDGTQAAKGWEVKVHGGQRMSGF